MTGTSRPLFCRTEPARETNPIGYWAPTYFLRKSLFVFPAWCSWYVLDHSPFPDCETHGRTPQSSRPSKTAGKPAARFHTFNRDERGSRTCSKYICSCANASLARGQKQWNIFIRLKTRMTRTMTIYNEAQINMKMAHTWLKNWSPKEFGTALRSPFENAAQRNAKLSGRPILKPIGGHFPIYLGPTVCGHGPCLLSSCYGE
jgi:hypothetical protein